MHKLAAGVSRCPARDWWRGRRHHAFPSVAWQQLLWDGNDREDNRPSCAADSLIGDPSPLSLASPQRLGDQPADQWDAKQLGEHICRLKHSTAEPEYENGYKPGE